MKPIVYGSFLITFILSHQLNAEPQLNSANTSKSDPLIIKQVQVEKALAAQLGANLPADPSMAKIFSRNPHTVATLDWHVENSLQLMAMAFALKGEGKSQQAKVYAEKADQQLTSAIAMASGNATLHESLTKNRALLQKHFLGTTRSAQQLLVNAKSKSQATQQTASEAALSKPTAK